MQYDWTSPFSLPTITLANGSTSSIESVDTIIGRFQKGFEGNGLVN